jgi:hypothetical protein
VSGAAPGRRSLGRSSEHLDVDPLIEALLVVVNRSARLDDDTATCTRE